MSIFTMPTGNGSYRSLKCLPSRASYVLPVARRTLARREERHRGSFTCCAASASGGHRHFRQRRRMIPASRSKRVHNVATILACAHGGAACFYVRGPPLRYASPPARRVDAAFH